MNQSTVKLKNIKKSYLGRILFEIDELSAYAGDKIAIIGNNGVGKSTLLKLINNTVQPDEGEVQIDTDFNYLEQIGNPNYVINDSLDFELMSRLSVPDNENMSGGEQTKHRIVEMLSNYKMGLLLDEPTTHLDSESIELIIEQLEYYYGTLLFVSHNRHFINKIANKIWEIKDGIIHEYHGNYDDYIMQKELAQKSLESKAEAINNEKERLKKAILKQQQYASDLNDYNKKTARTHNPGRLGQSKTKDTVQKNAFKKAKSIESRLKQLEDIDLPVEQASLKFPMKQSELIYNRFPIIAQDISIRRGDKLLLENTSFQFQFGKTTVITGPNGSGKSTLLHEIMTNPLIEKSPKLNIKTYEQMDYKLEVDESIISYMLRKSDQQETFIRTILSRLDFKQEELNKSVNNISGGEATRVALALLFLQRSNVIIMDEPTNFIDISTIEGLEEFIKAYQGMIILVSHDTDFIKNVADFIYIIENKRLKQIL